MLGPLIIVALILSACSSSILEQPTLQPTDTLSAPQSAASPNPMTTFKIAPTVTAKPDTIPTTVVTVRPVNETKQRVFEIESGYTEHQVVTAFWSDDGNSVYYAFVPTKGDKPLNWAVYDVATHVKINVSSPLKYDSQIWRRLNVPDPLDNSSLYPELLGYLAPSGTHIIFTINHGSQFATPPDPNPVTEIWIADLVTRRKTKLLELPPGIINQAVWFRNESKVIFDFGSEGSVRLYIADVRSKVVTPLADISDFNQGTEQHWDMSPDGTTLAIIDLRGTLWCISLEDGKSTTVEKFARNPSWSKDGKSLYYWWGSSYTNTLTLHSYVVSSGSVSALVSQSSLVNSFDAPLGSDFAVSPAGDKIVFWDGRLWLVELQN